MKPSINVETIVIVITLVASCFASTVLAQARRNAPASRPAAGAPATRPAQPAQGQQTKPAPGAPGPAAQPAPPAVLNVTIVYVTAPGKEATFTGVMDFAEWPIILDGKPAKINKPALTVPPKYKGWMQQEADGGFVVCTNMEVMRVKMGLDSIPVTDSKSGDSKTVTFIPSAGPQPGLPKALEVAKIKLITFVPPKNK